MHFSRSSEVLYFHTDVVSVHTDSHTDLKRHVVASWAIYTEYKASRQAESRMYRCREREKRSQKEKSTRNSIKIGEICIVPRNVGKRRDVVERLRGNRNLSMKEEEKAGKPDGGRTWRSRVKRETQKNEGRVGGWRDILRREMATIENVAEERMNEWHGKTAEVAVVRWWREGRAPVPALLP
ncbi:hypothetical protein G5I_02218 [Acromyrmex echinatior]|uniref:Uncharacterized protein n=1 Tax=Acromyrmex echinatior TaxID=103372 RepID=F4W9R2_ACREC|nr:hypothetical protein G5I_02218 [Acromyrmex echinatior]